MGLSLLEPRDWQMTLGERAALQGVLAALEPRLSIEIGTAQGGSLSRVAAASEEVHSFDLSHDAERKWPDNVQLHSGDSHALLPEFLAHLAAEGRNVDFVLVDGDHTADGVRRDVEDLLGSPAIGQTVIVLHDTLNDEVRRGITAARPERHPGVVHCDLDFIGGHLSVSGDYENHLWGGLGLILVDREGKAFDLAAAADPTFADNFAIFSDFRDRRMMSQLPRRIRRVLTQLPRRERIRRRLRLPG